MISVFSWGKWEQLTVLKHPIEIFLLSRNRVFVRFSDNEKGSYIKEHFFSVVNQSCRVIKIFRRLLGHSVGFLVGIAFIHTSLSDRIVCARMSVPISVPRVSTRSTMEQPEAEFWTGKLRRGQWYIIYFQVCQIICYTRCFPAFNGV